MLTWSGGSPLIQHTDDLMRGTTVRDSTARTAAGPDKHRSRHAFRLAAGGVAPAVVGLGAIPAFADHSVDLDEALDDEVDEFADAELLDPADLSADLEGVVELDHEPDDSLTTETADNTDDVDDSLTTADESVESDG